MKKERNISRAKSLEKFRDYLQERESALSTIEKYLRDVRTFFEYQEEEQEITKELLIGYKQWLMEHYSINSANSMIAALNQYLVFIELGRLRLKQIRVQRMDLRCLEKQLTKEEFRKMVRTARNLEKEDTAMIMETLCATGIRVSELKYFRVENIRNGIVRVWNKGKYRLVILPEILKKKLLVYIGKRHIRSGVIFRTRSGRAKDRSNIWREMKRIAPLAGIAPEKVFPHNLRHLFARTFYKETKNLINLADILGHSSLEVTRIYAAEGLQEWKRDLEKIRLLPET